MNNDRMRVLLCAMGGALLLVLVWGLFQHRWCSQAEATSARLREQAASVSAELEKSQKEMDEQRQALELKGRSVVEEKAKIVILEGKLAAEERAEKELKAQLERSQPKEATDNQTVVSPPSTSKGSQKASDKAAHQTLQAAGQAKAKNEPNNAVVQQAPKSGNEQPSASNTELQKVKADLDASQQALTLTKNLYNTVLNEEHAKDAEIARLKDTGTKVWNDLANANKEKDALAKEVTNLQAQITTMQNQLNQARKGTATRKN